MASAVGKTPPKPAADVKEEQKGSEKQNQNERKSQDKDEKNEKNQDNRQKNRDNGTRDNSYRDNRFQNRRGGRNQNPRFNQRSRDHSRESFRDGQGGSGNPFDQGQGDFFGEQSEEPKEPKKFTGRCRLFVGNITPDVTEEQFKELFTPFGEVSELFVNAARGFGFIRLVRPYESRASSQGSS